LSFAGDYGIAVTVRPTSGTAGAAGLVFGGGEPTRIADLNQATTSVTFSKLTLTGFVAPTGNDGGGGGALRVRAGTLTLEGTHAPLFFPPSPPSLSPHPPPQTSSSATAPLATAPLAEAGCSARARRPRSW